MSKFEFFSKLRQDRRFCGSRMEKRFNERRKKRKQALKVEVQRLPSSGLGLELTDEVLDRLRRAHGLED